MAEAIKKWILSIRFEYPRSIFDLSPVDPSLWEDYVLVHKTAEDALRTGGCVRKFDIRYITIRRKRRT